MNILKVNLNLDNMRSDCINKILIFTLLNSISLLYATIAAKLKLVNQKISLIYLVF